MIPNQTETQQATLKAPIFNSKTLETVMTKVRSYREGGIRLEHQILNGKHIFHNYGHGSSEATLAYGSATLAVRSLSSKVEKNKPMKCGIIGGDLAGLMTAIELSKKGYIVTIYADKFPKYSGSKKKDLLKSQARNGLWLPEVDDMKKSLKYELLSKISFDFYSDCI